MCQLSIKIECKKREREKEKRTRCVRDKIGSQKHQPCYQRRNAALSNPERLLG